MRRYQLTPYQSVYRDQNSVKINETLRQRFEQAFNADDAIASAVDQMEVADFEGDQALKMELERDTRGALQERAARGDYETMGMDVSRSARDFSTRYQPLSENYQKYAAYQQALKDSLDKKIGEGGITERTAALALAKSRQDYQGLQTNEDGSIDEGSFFAGYNTVGDVNISALMDEAMDGYVMHKGADSWKKVGQGPDGMYMVSYDGKWEEVKADDVKTMFQDVIADPNVQMALDQQAELETFGLTDEDIQKSLLVSLDGDAEDPNNTGGLRAALQEAIDEGRTDDAAAYEAMILRAEELLEGTGVETPEEMMALRRTFVEQQRKEAEIQREYGAAYKKYVRYNVLEDNMEVEYDQKWLSDYNRRKDNFVADLDIALDDLTLDNPGGRTHDSINAYITNQQGIIEADVLNFNQLEPVKRYLEANPGTEPFTLEQILTGEGIPEQFKQQVNADGQVISQGILGPIQRNIQNVQREIDIQNNLLQQAVDNTIDPWETEVYGPTQYSGTNQGGTYTHLTGNELVSVVSEALGRDVSKYEMMELMHAMSTYGGGSNSLDLGTEKDFGRRTFGYDYGTHGNISIRLGGIDEFMNLKDLTIPENRELTLEVVDQAFAGGFITSTERDAAKMYLAVAQATGYLDESVNDLFVEMHGSARKDLSAVTDEYLDEIVGTRTVSGWGSTVAPGFNEDEMQATTKAFRDYFVGKGLPSNMNYGFLGKVYSDGTGTIQNFRNEVSSSSWLGAEKYDKASRTSWAEGEIVVQDVLFNESPGPGDGAITLVVKNSLGDTEQLYVSQSEFKNTSLGNYFNDTMFRTATAKNRAKNSGLNQYTFDVGNGKAELTFDFTMSGSEYVIIETPITVDGVTTIDRHQYLTTDPAFERQMRHLDKKNLLPF